VAGVCGGVVESAGRGIFNARLQLRVHVQDVFLNPQTHCLVQFPENVRSKTFHFAVFLELMEEVHELFVSLFILRMCRTPVFFHALLFKLEMRVRVRLQKIHQVDQKFALRTGWIGFGQHRLKMIEVINQHPVLVVQRAGARGELFIPKDHGKKQFCLLSGSGSRPFVTAQPVKGPNATFV
jgi:hypothetical protein